MEKEPEVTISRVSGDTVTERRPEFKTITSGPFKGRTYVKVGAQWIRADQYNKARGRVCEIGEKGEVRLLSTTERFKRS